LASNVEGAGAFDDLVFRYRLREPEVWKTCFIQLKHKKNGGTIQRSSLTQMSGNFSLFKYFKSFCQIKTGASSDHNLKECGPFVDFDFVIYTNARMEGDFTLQGGDSDPLSILSSGTTNGKYITFDKTHDKDIFEFFKDLSSYHNVIRELDNLLKRRTSVDEEINETIKKLPNSVVNSTIFGNLDSLKSKKITDYVTTCIDEVANCDFTLFEEFLNKVKIFHSQSNEEALKGLTVKELQEACKASPSVANFIYTKFEEGFSNWWKRDGNVVWINENSDLWQEVQNNIITEIKETSNPEIQEIGKCDICFNPQHVQKLSDAIKQNTVLNIVTNSNVRILPKLKTYRALSTLGCKNSLFINIKSLILPRKEFRNFWPCKWSDALVVDCGSDSNVAQSVLDILQQSTDCGQGLDISDDNMAETLVDVLQKYQQKVILISPRIKASVFQSNLRNIYSYFEDNCNILDLDKNSQKQILERPVNFQGTNVSLSALVGTDPPESIKELLDSDVISILLSNEQELSVGRQLGDHCKYYVPRVLQHQIYLKEDILKLTDHAVTFVVSGLQADKLKKYLPPGQKICEFVYDESEKSHTFKIVSDFSKTGLSAESENMKPYNEAGQNVKPEEVRYIILGNKNPESDFRELKKLWSNVHWIHMEEGSFLWRDSKCNIDIIRRYIDKTKHQKYDMKSVVEHNDRTMLLVAEPGMGKSTFLYYMAHEVKKWKPSVWVLRVNLNEHTKEFEAIEFEQECADKCKMFLWSAAHSTEQDSLKVTKEIFLQALKEKGKMVIILDGFDEISPDYNPKVEKLMKSMRDETASKICISSRFSCQQELEDTVGNFAFTLQPFTRENQIQFLEQYWSEVAEISNQENLQTFAKKLLSLCSQNFSDKDGEFTGIPLQTMMLGEAFVNEAKEYCCSREFNLPEKFNLLSLFKTFWKKKCHIYFSEKNKMESSTTEVKGAERTYLKKHGILSLISLFSLNEVKLLLRDRKHDLEEAEEFLRSGKAQQFGFIRDIMDGKPQFIHRCFAEYFAAKWFTDNFEECTEFISNILFKSRYKVTRDIFDRILAEDSEIHDYVLNNDIHALKEFLKKKTDVNTLGKRDRRALHLAASYNSPCIQYILSFPGIEVNKPDSVLKWTPIRYADRTKSWMAMDILLQNGANPEDIVFTRQNAKAQEWGQAAVCECASKGYIKLLEFMLNFSDINIRAANNNIALHLATESGSVDIIKLIISNGISVNLTNTDDNTPLHVSAKFGYLEATKVLVENGAAINKTNKYGDTPLMMAAHYGKIDICRYLTEIGADINILDANRNTAFHYAAASGSVDILKLLLDKGMSVNLTNRNDSTPLHVSAKFGHLEAMKVLVEKGAVINKTNKYGNTPLMMAAYSGILETFRYLTQMGADINICNAKNNTAIHWASASGSVDIINLLLDNGISVNFTNTDDITPLHVSAKCGHLNAAKALVERGAAVNNTNIYGNTPLMVAAYKGKLEIFRYLTEVDADINIRNRNNNTALHLAAESGSVDIIKLLLDKCMSVNLTNTDDSTPLHVSAEFGHLEATKTLVDRGASVNKVNKYGDTPLTLGTRKDQLEVCRYLKEKGAVINVSSS